MASLIEARRRILLSAPHLEAASGDIATFKTDMTIPLKALTVEIPATQSGTGDPSPENVRPISGHITATVTRTGKNLYPYETIIAYTYAWYAGSKALADATNPVFLIAGQKYVLSWSNANSDAKVLVRVWRSDGQILEGAPNVLNMRMASYYSSNLFFYQSTPAYYSGTSPSDSNAAVIAPAENLWVDVRVQSGKGDSTNVQLELGSTATPYEPYIGTAIPISFPTEAGTVYAGTLTIHADGSAELAALPHYVSYAGEALVGPWVSSMDVYAEGATPTTGAEVVDLGGAAMVYQLTAEQIRTLKGSNNIWSDAGTTAVKYWTL